MIVHRAMAAVVLIGILAAQSTATRGQSAPALAIEHVTVLPMDRDVALAEHTVLVSQGSIVWVGPATEARVPAAATRVDGRGKFLIPGLADMHVHLRGVEDLSQFIAAGITTVRNMHGGPQHVEWREQVARGTLLGPAIVTTGPPLGQGFWRDPRFIGLPTTADAENVVRDHTRAGYDMLKVIQKISLPVYRRLLETARAAGMPVVGHVVPGVGLRESLAGSDAGIGPVRAGASLHCELTTLVAAGLTPFEALASATVNAGAFAKAHLKRLHLPFGTVTAGARADLVLLPADPRADIRAAARPLGVVLRGIWRPR